MQSADHLQVEIIMNRITLFLLTFAILINILLIIVEATLNRTLHLCSDAFGGNSGFSYITTTDLFLRGCYATESR